jgi:hypothetical protein
MAIRYGTKEHEEFAVIVGQVLSCLDGNFASKFSSDPSGAQQMESTDLLRGLRRQIEEFQLLCNAANSRIEPLQEEYQNKAKALAGRFQALNTERYLELNSSGKKMLQQALGI